MDSNHRSRKTAELQSAPFGHSGNCPISWQLKIDSWQIKLESDINCQLSTFHYQLFWASCRIRTNDPEITNHVLWPTELKRQIIFQRKWAVMDSNHRRRKPAELQSAPFGHSGNCPNQLTLEDLKWIIYFIINCQFSIVNFQLFWASCRIRTNDPEITNHVLWPTELKRHCLFLSLRMFISQMRCKGRTYFWICNTFDRKNANYFSFFYFIFTEYADIELFFFFRPEKKKMNKRLFILFVFLFWSDLSICHGLAICQTNPLKTGVFRCKVQVGRKFSSFEGVKKRFL